MSDPVRLFPALLPDGEEFLDDSYSRAELERMEWQELRAVASEHPSDDVNGKMDRESIESVLEGRKRV